jgi:hypothetical protein
MASTGLKSVFAACAAGSLVLSSTAAVAAAPAPVQQPSAWAVLSVMSGGASAAALCGSAATTAAAQGQGGCVLPVVDAPPSPATEAAVPAPPVVEGAGMGISPLLLGLLAIAAGVGVFLAVHNNNHANSPA